MTSLLYRSLDQRDSGVGIGRHPAPVPVSNPPFDDDTPLTVADAETHVSGICFKTGPPQFCGVELEWLLYHRADPRLPVTAAPRLAEQIRLDRGQLTVEPGGQLEYSSSVADSLKSCVADTSVDLAVLRAALSRVGLRMAGFGLDPYREPRRLLDLPRYQVMEQHFDAEESLGRWMMCCSASVQVCLDAGRADATTAGLRHRWRLVHAITPVLIAVFANSPVARRRPTGWLSTRQAVWASMDHTRTAPVSSGDPAVDTDPTAEWVRYALDATVLAIRREPGLPWTAPEGLTFRSWIDRGGRRPTRSDLDYHLTTLFPPVRPHGYLELRMIDAQRGDGWIVPLAVCSALLGDPRAGSAALAAAEPLWHGVTDPAQPLRHAARWGMRDPMLAAAARTCLLAAVTALPAGAIRSAVERFADSHPARDRCPADDLSTRCRGPVSRFMA